MAYMWLRHCRLQLQASTSAEHGNYLERVRSSRSPVGRLLGNARSPAGRLRPVSLMVSAAAADADVNLL
jgi:hypothetical protein